MTAVLVFGGYGTFGSLVCRELARLGLTVTVGGRSRDRAEALARELGPAHRGLAADATDAASCRAALAGHAVAVGCAGPFSALGRTLLDACRDAGCHYADIADDRSWARLVRAEGAAFRARGLAAVYGCSSVPGLSEALAVLAASGASSPPERARVTLFIGNDNPKGRAAIASLVGQLGRPIEAPQGVLRGFGHRESVDLPPPFGRRAVYDFESPDYDVLPERLGVGSVSVKVGFENGAAARAFAALARLGSGYGPGTARLFTSLGRLRTGGSSGGAVMVELSWGDGTVRRAALSAARDGQRMAALPAVLVARALADGTATERGALTAAQMLGPRRLLAAVAAEGFTLSPES